MTTLPRCDVLALGPHPDDLELGAAGTLLLLQKAGKTMALVDCTRGEKGSRGTVAERDAEALAASRLLGAACRTNLGLPDTGVRVDDASTDLLVAALRAVRPSLFFAPHEDDVHPDHTAVAQLASRAFFLAGLRHYQPRLGEAHRPRVLLRYPGNRPVPPTLVVDITNVAAAKADIVKCYRSQLNPPDRSHLTLGLDVWERSDVRDRFWGASIGVRVGEPFVHDGPLPLREVQALLG